MFAPKYNYWNNYPTETTAYPNYPYAADNNFSNNYNVNNNTSAAITSPAASLTSPKTNDQNNNNTNTNNEYYLKELIEKLAEKERDEKHTLTKDYCSQAAEYDAYVYQIQNQHSDSQAMTDTNTAEGKLEMIKKSTFLSKFYKPDGTPIKSLWDSDSSLREQRTYKYDPKPLERRKNPRSFVSDEKKTNEYWEKRRKNNIAARKSREDRRRKEIEILKNVDNLKTDNLKLKVYAQKIMAENQSLKYEIDMLKRL